MGLVGKEPSPPTDASLAGIAEAIMLIAALIGYFLMLSIQSFLEVQRGRQVKEVNNARTLAAIRAQVSMQSRDYLPPLPPKDDEGHIALEFKRICSTSDSSAFDLDSVENPRSFERQGCKQRHQLSRSGSILSSPSSVSSYISLSSFSEPAAAQRPASETRPSRCYTKRLSSIESPRLQRPTPPDEEEVPFHDHSPLLISTSWWSVDDDGTPGVEKQKRRMSRLKILRGLKDGDACAAHNVFPKAKPRIHHPLMSTYHALPESEATSWVWASSLHKSGEHMHQFPDDACHSVFSKGVRPPQAAT